MKIAICSDLHLEFADLDFDNPGADVLILSGDICVARDLMDHDDGVVSFGKSNRYHEFFQRCCKKFPQVLYVAGNHEHYHGDFKTTVADLKKFLGYLDNLHILDKETFEIDDTVFVGSTLWTDMNKGDPLTLYKIGKLMNDFRIIDNSNREVNYKTYDDPDNLDKPTFRTRIAKFSPEDAAAEHTKCLDYIRHVYDNTAPWQQIVVIGHHTPSQASCHPKYASDREMNGGYHSELSGFILDRPRIKLWTHGHTHELFDYQIGSTRVVCNPRGYDGYEDISDNFKLKVIEL